MKLSPDIPLHQLLSTDFYVSSTDGGNLGKYEQAHRIDFFAIIWFGANEGTHYIDFTPYPIRKNLVYLLARNQVHALPGIPPQAKVIIFSKDFFDSIKEDNLRFLFLPLQNDGLVIPNDMLEPMSQLFDLIQLENQGASEPKLLHFYISAFLLQLQRFNLQQLGPGSAEHHERLYQLFLLLAEHYKTHKLVQFYADKLGLTPRRLNQIVKERLDLSVSQLIYNYVLIEAKRQINHSTKSIKEIALSLGFTSQSYFSRFFKKQTGTTPELFRQ